MAKPTGTNAIPEHFTENDEELVAGLVHDIIRDMKSYELFELFTRNWTAEMWEMALESAKETYENLE